MRSQPYPTTGLLSCKRLCASIILACLGCFGPTRGLEGEVVSPFRLVDVGFADTEGQLGALVDINGDKFVDMLVLGSDERSLEAYVWSHKRKLFERDTRVFGYRSESRIVNVIPTDLSRDGKVDALYVMESTTREHQYELAVVPQDQDGAITSLPPVVADAGEPFVMDISADMKPAVLGEFDGSGKTTIAEGDLPFHPCAPSTRLSPVFMDFDGDCEADFLIPCRSSETIELWTRENSTVVRKLSFTRPHPAEWKEVKSGEMAWTDVDGDGAVDLVFFQCHTIQNGSLWWGGRERACELVVAFNEQMPLCEATTGFWASLGFTAEYTDSRCRSKRNLCSKDPESHFDLESKEKVQRMSLVDIFGAQDPKSEIHAALPDLSSPLRVGDFNLDGYPDLVYVSREGQDAALHVLLSVPYSERQSQARHHTRFYRHLVRLPLGSAGGNVRVAIFDLKENGSQDITVSTGDGRILVWENLLPMDAFFLRAYVSDSALAGSGKEGRDGVSLSGATFKFLVLDTHGRNRLMQFTTLGQTSYRSLNSPYMFFGLGRTNNYIEELHLGLPGLLSNGSSTRTGSWRGIVPNSQLAVFPRDADDTSTWTLVLFVRPSQYSARVILMVLACMGVLGVVIGSLHLIERREDAMERRRMLYTLHLDRLL